MRECFILSPKTSLKEIFLSGPERIDSRLGIALRSKSFLLVSSISVVSFFAHIIISLYPSYDNTDGLTDELIYAANAGRILSGDSCTGQFFAQFPRICNYEHPPLAKLLIAVGMALLGRNNLGWRILPICLGTACIPLVYLICLRISGNNKLATVAAVLLSMDTLFFMYSNMASLDMPELFFGIAAFTVYFYETKIGKIGPYVLAGLLMGLSALCKETGVFLLGALITFILIFGKGDFFQRIKKSTVIVGVAAIVFIVFLQAYDSLLTPFPVFTDQIAYMMNFALSDKAIYYPGLYYFTAHEPLGVVNSWVCQSCWRSLSPFDWITFFSPVEFAYPPPPGSSHYIIIGGFRFVYDGFAFYGITNMFETWMLYIWIPIAFFILYKFRVNIRRGLQGSDRLLIFALIWFTFTWLPYVALYLQQRAEYEYYMVSAVPALAIGASYLVTRESVPNKVTIAYLILVALWFCVFFPDKSFLPTVIRL